ncbi:MAG: RNA-binding protein [Prolixibacteraceae bacterium]|nr:RNA-binding protein [Prolixibacteraceae bacterium]
MDIFVAKLNSETTADHLKELFSQFGQVNSAKLIMDRETSMSKCYGFVEMEDESEAEEAIEQLNESNFMDNIIVVKKSEPKTSERRSFDRRPGGGGGGGNRRFEGNRRFDRDRNFNRDRNRGDRRGFNRDDRSNDFNRY